MPLFCILRGVIVTAKKFLRLSAATTTTLQKERENMMNWKTMSLSQKIATVIAGLAVVVWVIPKVKPDLLPFDPTYPALAVFTVCEAVVYWKQQRKWAYLLIAGAVISMACFLLEQML